MPLTGGQALYGNDQVKAAQWAVDALNAKGGINGKKLQMVVLDTQADPQVGIQAVNRLVSVDKVPVFVTAWSGVVKAVAPIANDNKVVELSVGASSPDVAKLGDYVYTTFPLADVDIRAVAEYAANELGKKKAAVLFVNNETVNLADYLAARRVRKPECAPCPHRSFCGGFYELDDVPEPEWLVTPESLVRPVRDTLDAR